MLQQLCAVLVDRWCRGVGREAAVGEFGGEIFARVEVLEKAAHGLQIRVGQLDAVALCDTVGLDHVTSIRSPEG